MVEPHQHGKIEILAKPFQLTFVAAMRDAPVYAPVRIGLQAVKMNNLPAPSPARVMLEIVRQEIVTIVRYDRDLVPFSNCKCVHDDFVRIHMKVVGYGTLEIFKVVTYFRPDHLKSTSLNREHTELIQRDTGATG